MKKGIKNRWIFSGVILVLAITGLSFISLDNNAVYFYTPNEAKVQAGDLSSKVIKVGGMVQPGSVKWQPENLDLQFTLSDLKGTDIQVAFKGTPPDMFKEGQGVVCEGNISDDGQSIKARHLLVKHSEEYKPPHGETASQEKEKELLQKSLFKE